MKRTVVQRVIIQWPTKLDEAEAIVKKKNINLLKISRIRMRMSNNVPFCHNNW
ncbi:hypothetical protein EAE96_010503 [Botrytis aclada]|nr:hypothetical protein EAE96_010503 [Botrytis aclada]